MTSELFGESLKRIDRSMGSKKRKILLFIDNCKAHSKLPLLKNISVEFLPANTTSKLQPLDQGVIRSFKVYYRKELIRKLLNSIDEKKTLPKINILDAMRMIDYAWRNVSEKTIKNGFIQAGFKKMTEEPENGQETEDIDIELQEEDWMEFRNMLEDVSFEEFVNVDDAVATCGVLTEEEIINEVRGDSGKDDDETEHIDVPKVSAKDAENAIETIRNFLESQEGVGEDGFSAIAKLRRIVSEKKNVRHQTLLTDFLQ